MVLMSSEDEKNYKLIELLFEQKGADDYIGEPVTQQEHALQCAHFARESSASSESVIHFYCLELSLNR